MMFFFNTPTKKTGHWPAFVISISIEKYFDQDFFFSATGFFFPPFFLGSGFGRS